MNEWKWIEEKAERTREIENSLPRDYNTEAVQAGCQPMMWSLSGPNPTDRMRDCKYKLSMAKGVQGCACVYVLAGAYACVWLTSLCAVYRFSQIDLHSVKLTPPEDVTWLAKRLCFFASRHYAKTPKVLFGIHTSSMNARQAFFQVCKQDVK